MAVVSELAILPDITTLHYLEVRGEQLPYFQTRIECFSDVLARRLRNLQPGLVLGTLFPDGTIYFSNWFSICHDDLRKARGQEEKDSVDFSYFQRAITKDKKDGLLIVAYESNSEAARRLKKYLMEHAPDLENRAKIKVHLHKDNGQD